MLQQSSRSDKYIWEAIEKRPILLPQYQNKFDSTAICILGAPIMINPDLFYVVV